MSRLLEARVVEKKFTGRSVLRDVSLHAYAGETVSLVGPSGCGKSTLLRIVAGLERAYSGEVRLGGRRLEGLTREIGFIFQEPRLFPWLTVRQNVAFDLRGRDDRDARVDGLLAEVGLAGYGDALPKQLSGGQAQRVAIARGLYTQPRLLLLDEPFSAVDAFTRMKLQDLLATLAREHYITLLLVTHDLDEALYLSDRVLVMGSDPGHVRAILPVTGPRPRDRRDPRLAALKSEALDHLYSAHAI